MLLSLLFQTLQAIQTKRARTKRGRNEIWNDLEELRAEYSLRADKYLQKAKEFLPESKKERKYKSLSLRYQLAQKQQLYNILSCGHLDEIMSK